MISFTPLACAGLMLLALPSVSHAQPGAEGLPDQPFKTVHLMAVEPAQEGALRAAIGDFNAEFSKEGCAACAYHLLRMVAGSEGSYNVLVYSDWPSRAEYVRIHGSAGYASTAARNPVFADLESRQFYGRFVEIR